MIFPALFAVFFYTFLIGLIWPSNAKTTIPQWLLDAITRSLWISWLVVVVSYWLNLPNLLWLLAPISLLIILFSQKRTVVSFSFPFSTLSLIASLSAFVFAISIVRGVDVGNYRLIFHGWDALVSWNGWGRQLAANQFVPQQAAYPILFPGLWSLIYKAQGQTDLWVVTKASMLILLPILTLVVGCLVEIEFFLTASLIGYYAFEFYFVRQHQPMLSGNMDIPVAIMVLASGALLAVASSHSDQKDLIRTRPAFISASVAVGLASITKQAGMFMILPWALCAVTLRYRKQISGRDLIIATTAALIPIVTFFTMLLYSRADPIGNINHLRELSSRGAGSSIASTIILLSNALPQQFILLFCGLSATNIFGWRTLLGRLGLSFLFMAVAGVLIFSNCCAYDVRNGWWIFSLLAASSACGVIRLDRMISSALHVKFNHRLDGRMSAFGAFASCVLAAFIAARMFSVEKLQAAQDTWQAGVVPPEVASLISAEAPKLGSTGRMISTVQPLEFFPAVRGRFVFCYYLEVGCVARAISRFPGSLVLVSNEKGSYYEDFRANLTPDRILGRALVYELYGPYR
ncbi:hypothetical protein KQX62_17075 [Rhodopseudomonas palustris]|uniref:Glycosyltransferase RgtA/B/C/D-like domain-containing protein n=1 Tax=Rhodopseudomonas palustris TaxID=1076 RepID=A0AAX3DUA3_RHOPL|nr:hypothetical protein [Rhodopseudomonas palustris]UYO38426.1 hypothetical protein KQX62_17075 [Rhodopseudomonas palustris]